MMFNNMRNRLCYRSGDDAPRKLSQQAARGVVYGRGVFERRAAVDFED